MAASVAGKAQAEDGDWWWKEPALGVSCSPAPALDHLIPARLLRKRAWQHQAKPLDWCLWIRAECSPGCKVASASPQEHSLRPAPYELCSQQLEAEGVVPKLACPRMETAYSRHLTASSHRPSHEFSGWPKLSEINPELGKLLLHPPSESFTTLWKCGHIPFVERMSPMYPPASTSLS